jgi:hypothetical protein
MRDPATLSAPKQFDELFNGESSVGDDATEGAGSKPLVVGNNHPSVGLVAAEHHVATGLSAEHKSHALQSGADFTTG